MLIKLNDLPSRGWKTELPPTFDMIPFRSGRAISDAIETKEMFPLIQALIEHLPEIDANQLSIPDAYYLLLQQRLINSDVKPILFEWQCGLPLYQYSDGLYPVLQDDRPSLAVMPCENWTPTELNADSLTIVSLSNESEEFDLPRVKNFIQANSSRFDWIASHLNSDHRKAIATLEEQEDLVLWTRLTKWVESSQHGILSYVECSCSRCNRTSKMMWNFTPEVFK